MSVPTAAVHIPSFPETSSQARLSRPGRRAARLPTAGAGAQVSVLRYDLPLARAGEGAAASGSVPLDADHRPGNLACA